MTARAKGVTKGLLAKLLEDQERRANREKKLSFEKKLKILDQLMKEARKQTR